MADNRGDDELAGLRRVLALAQEKTEASRRIIFENITDLFLTPAGRLSDRERLLMSDILGRLVREMELRLRRELSNRLAALPDGPRDLMVMLANDEIEVARPVLRNSPVLRAPDLIEIVKHRSHEHLLAIALRAPLSAEVSEAIVDRGDERVIEQLLKNPDAILSRRALEYLVAESQRVDQFQEPLLSRADLPPDLAHRMFWWVSAALRQVILNRFTIDVGLLDDSLSESAKAAIADLPPPSIDDKAAQLIEAAADGQVLNHHLLVQMLRGGKIAAFVAAFARFCRLQPLIVRRVVFDPSGESLAIACRAVNVERADFASIFMLSRQGLGHQGSMPATALRDILKF
ncbi:MAG: DUF2336 domain-containing protein, partial [Rhodospirillales bacterium]|nr:DUF2336 domain-containing protein [Rhodospirillales bacterium]